MIWAQVVYSETCLETTCLEGPRIPGRRLHIYSASEPVTTDHLF